MYGVWTEKPAPEKEKTETAKPENKTENKTDNKPAEKPEDERRKRGTVVKVGVADFKTSASRQN